MLHHAHLGMPRVKATPQSYVWWLGIDNDIGNAVKTCPECDTHHNTSPVAELHPWEWPSMPSLRVDSNNAGPCIGKLIDSHSKLLEVIMVPNTLTAATVDILNAIFTTLGLFEVLVTDSGRVFTSEHFSKYCLDGGHVRTP